MGYGETKPRSNVDRQGEQINRGAPHLFAGNAFPRPRPFASRQVFLSLLGRGEAKTAGKQALLVEGDA
jgi:hypothetical protein